MADKLHAFGIPPTAWRLFTIVAIVAAALYLSLCAYLYFVQRDWMYFPAGTHGQSRRVDFTLDRDGIVLRGWVSNPQESRALLYFGGNAEDVGSERSDLAAMFPDRAVYVLPYRGYGDSDGSPSEAALFADAVALFDRVHADHHQVAAVGRSLGAGVASYLASKRPLERLALVTPFDSMVAVAQSHYPLLPVRWLLKDRYESARFLHEYRKPTLILQAGRDRIVPAGSTQRLIAALPVKPQVVIVPDADHNTISNDPVYAEALSQFMDWPDAPAARGTPRRRATRMIRRTEGHAQPPAQNAP